MPFSVSVSVVLILPISSLSTAQSFGSGLDILDTSCTHFVGVGPALDENLELKVYFSMILYHRRGGSENIRIRVRQLGDRPVQVMS